MENTAVMEVLTNISFAKSHKRPTLMMRSFNSPDAYFMKNFALSKNVRAMTAGSIRTLTNSFRRINIQSRIKLKRMPPIVAPISNAATGRISLFVPLGITVSNICLFT